MARTFTAASNHRLEYNGAVVTAVPITFAAWVKLSAVGAVNRMIIECRDKDTGADTHRFALYMSNLERISAGTADASATAASGDATTQITATTWNHAAAVFSATNSRTAYANGAAATTNTSSRTPSGVDYTMVGCSIHSTSTYQIPWDGDIAEAAIWSAALTAGEITALAKGASPMMVRPASLMAYWPIVGRIATTEPDVVGSQGATITGAVQAAHPRIMMPRRQRFSVVPAAVGGGFQAAWARNANTLVQAA